MLSEPTSQSLKGNQEFIAALDTLCGMAQQNLYLFDKDFAQQGFNSVARFEILHRLLLASTTHRVYFLAHDVRYLATQCARIEILIKQFGTAIAIHQLPKSLQHLREAFAVADTDHCLRRFHFDAPDGVLELHQASQARAYQGRFLEMWANSTAAPVINKLGL